MSNYASHYSHVVGGSSGSASAASAAAAAAAAADPLLTSPSSHTAAVASLNPLLQSLNAFLHSISNTLESLPGSAIVLRYIRSSYQDDPVRSLLELLLLIFAVRTVLQSRTRGNQSGSNFVKLNKKEIDELVADFTPEPLCAPLSSQEALELASIPTVIGGASPRPHVALDSIAGGKPRKVINLASYNFTDLADSDEVKERAIQALRTYGVGSCSPPGFYGTIDVHMKLEEDIARFLGVDRCIIYSQGFSTISSVIPAFSKRGDVIVADRGVNFAIQKGIQISRSHVKYYDHNSMTSLEATLQQVLREAKRKRGPLTRRFIVTEGIFEGDGAKTNLKRLIELKRKYKFRLVLDESISFGTVGKSGRGLTELYGVPAKEVDILVGSMANTLGGAGGFCAGTEEVVYHQRINGASFVFSAALPAMLAVAASAAIERLESPGGAELLARLRRNVEVMREVWGKVESVKLVSDADSPLVHLQVRSKAEPHPLSSATSRAPARGDNGDAKEHVVAATANGSAAAGELAKKATSPPPPPPSSSSSTPAPHDLSLAEQQRLLQAVVDDALEHGVLLVRHKRLPSILPAVLETGAEARPSIRVAASAALGEDEVRRAAEVVRDSLVRMLGRTR